MALTRRFSLSTLLRHAVHWDFLLTLVIVAVFLVSVLSSNRPLENVGGILTAAITVGVAIAVAAAVASRWLADRIKDDTYGEVLRALDPDESQAQRPFLIVGVVAGGTALGGVLLVISQGELGRTLTVWLYGALLFLALYSLLGFLDLLWITYRHQRRQAKLRSLREEENRRRKN